MKKYIIILLLLANAIVYSQNGDLKKQTYLRIGLSVPGWKYHGLINKSDWPDDPKRTGMVFEFGNIYMINALKISPGLRLGINIDYLSLNYHKFSFSNDINDYKSHFIYAGSKIGPSISYCPIHKLAFDAYFKLNPIWASLNTNIYGGDDAHEDDFWFGWLGLKYSVGLNIRYSILMMGIEYNPGCARFRKYDKEENKLTDEYMSNAKDNKDRTPVPGFNITLGLSF